MELNSSLPGEGLVKTVTYFTEEQFQTYIKFAMPLSIVLAILGLVLNIINIRTFYRLGLKDGITVSFFGLSLMDAFYAFVTLWPRTFTILIFLEAEGIVWFKIHPSVGTIFGANICHASSSISMFVLTFLAVARCLCVAMPLYFKNIFTKSRCIAFLVSIVVVCTAAYLPLFANMGVERRLDPRKNVTRIFPSSSSRREQVRDVIVLVLDTIMPVIVQATLIVCVFVMSYTLKVSAKFRQSVKHQDSKDSKEAAEVKLSARDRRVILQVLLISVIYILFSSPKIFNSLYTLVEPEFDLNKLHHYLYYLLYDFRYFLDCLNTNVNFFVYYAFNTAFREVCFKSK